MSTLAPPPPRADPPRRARFWEALGRHGARTALVWADGRLSYAELARRVERRAAEIGDGRRLVQIEGGNGPETLITYLAALAGGHVAWLAPHRPGPDEAPVRPDVVVGCHGDRAEIVHSGAAAQDLHPELALLLGTSGSTGAPKLVRISHAGLQANAESIVAYLGIDGSDVAPTALPVHYSYGLSVVNTHLLAGAGLVLTGASVTDPAFWDIARGEGATSLAGVPHTFDLLERTGFAGDELPRLRYVTQAGGRMAPESVRRWAAVGRRHGWRLVVMYGQTEATARIAYLPPGEAERHPDAIGIAIPGGELTLAPVPEAGPGVGELVYRGPNVMLGYAQAPADLARGRTVTELRTGDLAVRSPEGLFRIVGRRSRFLKLFGLRIDLEQIERRLAADGLRAACAGTDACLVIAVEGDAAEVAHAGRVADLLGLPAHAVCVRAVDALPRTPNGKPDYAAVTALRQEPRPVARPGDVAAVFREVLERDRIDDRDTFAGLGGDSLSYVEMSVALEEVLGELPADWPSMTVAELSALVPAEPPTRRRLAGMETDVALRAGAIALVVASHMTDVIPAGGAHLLLVVAGYAFARVLLGGVDAPRRLARWSGSVARIALPTMAWIALMSLLVGGYGTAALLLVNGHVSDGAIRGAEWHYWYVEALVQVLILAIALFSVPAVRRLERRAPLELAIAVLAVALLPRLLVTFDAVPPTTYFLPQMVAWLFVLGWVVHRARTASARMLVSVIAAATVIGFFGDPVREAVVLAGVMALIWVPRVVMPRPLIGVLAPLAAASLAIYLTHWQVWPVLDGPLPTAVAWVLTLATGVAAWWVVSRGGDLTRRAWSGVAAAAAPGGRPWPVSRRRPAASAPPAGAGSR